MLGGAREAADQVLEREQPVGAQDRGDAAARVTRRSGDDRFLFGARRIIDAQLEHESIQLRFGERVRAFLLDRVLRGQHEERLGQRVRLARRRDGVFLHCLQERGLRLGRRAVDLIGQHDVGEDRPVHEPEHAVPGRVVLLEQLGARDVTGHEVGRELHPRERQLECLCDRLHQERLGEPRHPDEERVAAREERRDEIVHDGLLPHDALGDLRGECAAGARELVEQLDVAFIARGGGASGSRRSHDRNVVGDDRESVPGWRRAGPTLVSIAGTGVAGSGKAARRACSTGVPTTAVPTAVLAAVRRPRAIRGGSCCSSAWRSR